MTTKTVPVVSRPAKQSVIWRRLLVVTGLGAGAYALIESEVVAELTHTLTSALGVPSLETLKLLLIAASPVLFLVLYLAHRAYLKHFDHRIGHTGRRKAWPARNIPAAFTTATWSGPSSIKLSSIDISSDFDEQRRNWDEINDVHSSLIYDWHPMNIWYDPTH